ncbi:hypothetical protein N657DRAFT_650342 [Parathielavia appendiculata]|uniref:Uncharacterized protein n=1 Tax=Parathielavia appendiculata TaxID=2587402 RepID=A0AAN6YZB8_9PEZI|nr:hypothetical protein N657DRAFT_650342 [Parathielavia appendiculata]
MTLEPLCLGALPPELFDNIFFALDTIRDLAKFVVTARFVHNRFKARRQTILFHVLQKELGYTLPDARFLFVFPYSDPGDAARYHNWIHVMTGAYLDMLGRSGDQAFRGDPGPPTPKELTALCRTLHLINSITDIYATVQLTSFDKAGGGETPATTPPSRLERRRIMRAFYRRQIVSNAWASTRRPAHWDDDDSHAFSNTSTENGQDLGLFAAFDPWDMQQIDHVNCFILRLCRALVLRAAEMEAEISPSQFGNLHAHLDHLVRYLRAHRAVAEAAVADLQSGNPLPHDERLEREYVNRYELLPLLSCWQTHRSQEFPDPVRDRQEQDGLPMDPENVGDGPGQVPYGWSDALRGRHIHWYGEGLRGIPWLPPCPTTEKSWAHTSVIECWRRYGFALWDRKRVEALKRLSWFQALQTGFVLDFCS